jgi:DNA recombination protein RmuC
MTHIEYTIISCITILIFALLVIFVKLQKIKFQSENNKLLIELEFLKSRNIDLLKEIEHLRKELTDENEKKHLAEKNQEILEVHLQEMQKRMMDWEKSKEQALENAKAVIFDVGGKLSQKLMDDHKRETQSSREESIKKFQEITNRYHKDFETVVQGVSNLNNQIKESKDVVDTVYQALLNPGSAGCLAEITLENILKSSGLIAGKDFVMQYSLQSNDCENNIKKRPDAVVFLPCNNILVIDSKASKFFLEIARAEGTLATN